jgi:hypothetical protein
MKNILLLFSAFILLSGCKKTTVDALPEATQTGANTFGLKLDGAYWVPQRFGIASTAPILEALYTGTNDLLINARNFSSSPTETEFEIFIKNITGTGVFELNTNTDKYPYQSGSYAYYIKRRINPLNQWITSSQYNGTVTISRFDLPNRIISGTFSFHAGSIDSSSAPIAVTEGRFDVMIQ